MFDTSEAHLSFEQWVKCKGYAEHFLEIATGMLLPITDQGAQLQKAWDSWQAGLKEGNAIQPLVRR